MGPMLKQRPVLLQQLLEMVTPECLVTGEDDLVVSALDSGNAVDLHKTEIMNKLQQILLAQRPRRRCGQSLLGQENPPRDLV